MKKDFNGFSTLDLIEMKKDANKRKEIKELQQEIERLNNIIDELIDIIAISLNDDVVEKAFNMNLDDFKIWIKEKIKK